MLVLSRKKNEWLRIADDIRIVVVEIRGDKVRLGVEAPTEIPVHREEVFQAIHRQMEAGKPLREIEDQLDLEENRGDSGDGNETMPSV